VQSVIAICGADAKRPPPRLRSRDVRRET
jgi:hypothetical protein